jgi:hypothetical protein
MIMCTVLGKSGRRLHSLDMTRRNARIAAPDASLWASGICSEYWLPATGRAHASSAPRLGLGLRADASTMSVAVDTGVLPFVVLLDM